MFMSSEHNNLKNKIGLISAIGLSSKLQILFDLDLKFRANQNLSRLGPHLLIPELKMCFVWTESLLFVKREI